MVEDTLMKMSYRIKKGKYIINKGDGVFLGLTRAQVVELHDLLDELVEGRETKHYQEDARR